MKRVLSSIGIGAATVDTVLPESDLRPGDAVEVDVELHGGESTQEIGGIHFVLKARSASDDGTEEHVLTEVDVDRSVTLDPGEERTIPVDIDVPLWTPVTTSGVSVWLGTRLDIDWARDPTDEDQVEVIPDEHVSVLFDAFDDLGFTLHGSDLVDVPHVDDRPIAQRFRFEPTDGPYEADLDAIEVTVMPRPEDLRVFVEYDLVDQIADERDLDFDLQEISMTLDRASVEAVRGRLLDGIEQHT